MKKEFHKIAKHGLGLGNYSSVDYIAYYTYPSVVINVHRIPPVSIQKAVPIIWSPRLMQDKYSPLMPPIVIKIASNYIGRFIAALLPKGS